MRQRAFQLAIVCAAGLLFTQSPLATGLDTFTRNAAGAHIFQSHCAVCHGTDGAGSPDGKSLHVPDLRTDNVQMQPDTTIAHFISEGSGSMPSFKESLSPQQILDEVQYIRFLAKRKKAH